MAKDRKDILFHEDESDRLGTRAANLGRGCAKGAHRKRWSGCGVKLRSLPGGNEAARALEGEQWQFASAADRKQAAQGCFEVLLAYAEAEVELSRLPGRPAADRRPAAQRAIALLLSCSPTPWGGRTKAGNAAGATTGAEVRYHAQAGDDKEAAAGARSGPAPKCNRPST